MAKEEYKLRSSPFSIDDSKKFREEFRYGLVDTVEKFDRCLESFAKRDVLAVDTESSGLDFENDLICGASVSVSGYMGLYFPFRHLVGQNLPIECLQRLVDVLKIKRLLFFNGTHDLLMFKHDPDITVNVDEWRTFEVMALVYNGDSNIKKNSLEAMQLFYLNRVVPSLKAVTGNTMKFNQILPEDGTYYACCDSAGTYALYDHLSPILLRECRGVVQLDSLLAKRMTFYSEQKIHVRTDIMAREAERVEGEIEDLENAIFDAVGYMFNIDSPPQLSKALLSIGVDTGLRTKKGDMVVNKKVVKSRLDHEIGAMITKRNSLSTQLSSFFGKLTDDTGRIQYKIFRAPTGRLVSGNSGRSPHPCYLRMNYMNLPNPDRKDYFVSYVGNGEENTILGWKVFPDGLPNVYKEKAFLVDGMRPEKNVRRGVTVPDLRDWLFCAFDYSQEELRIAGYLSRDPVLVKAYDAGEDIHQATAWEMFGRGNYDGKKRKLAKIGNFSLLFDGTAKTIHKNTGLDMATCKMIYARYWKALCHLKRWKQQMVSQCISNGGICYTAFGRPRRLAYYLTHQKSGVRNFGKRSVVSHIVQGTGGDVLRIVLINLVDFLKKHADKVKFIGCVHDEVDFAIRKDSFVEMAPKIKKIMEVTVPDLRGGEFKLPVDVSIGYDFGSVFEFQEKDGLWSPVPKEA